MQTSTAPGGRYALFLFCSLSHSRSFSLILMLGLFLCVSLSRSLYLLLFLTLPNVSVYQMQLTNIIIILLSTHPNICEYITYICELGFVNRMNSSIPNFPSLFSVMLMSPMCVQWSPDGSVSTHGEKELWGLLPRLHHLKPLNAFFSHISHTSWVSEVLNPFSICSIAEVYTAGTHIPETFRMASSPIQLLQCFGFREPSVQCSGRTSWAVLLSAPQFSPMFIC